MGLSSINGYNAGDHIGSLYCKDSRKDEHKLDNIVALFTKTKENSPNLQY